MPAARHMSWPPPTSDDQIRVIVTATNSYGSGTATASSVGPISSGAPVNSCAARDHGDGPAGTGADRKSGHVVPGGQRLHLPVAALDRQRLELDEHRQRDEPDADPTAMRTSPRSCALRSRRPTHTARRASPPARSAQSARARRRTPQPPVINGTPRQGHVLTVSSDWNPAGIDVHLHVGALGRRTQLEHHRERDRIELHADRRRRRPEPPGHGDRHQRVRTASNTSATAGPIAADPPVNTALANDHRHHPADVHAARRAGVMERREQRVQLPVAAVDRRQPLVGDLRRQRPGVHAHARRRRRRRSACS